MNQSQRDTEKMMSTYQNSRHMPRSYNGNYIAAESYSGISYRRKEVHIPFVYQVFLDGGKCPSYFFQAFCDKVFILLFEKDKLP